MEIIVWKRWRRDAPLREVPLVYVKRIVRLLMYEYIPIDIPRQGMFLLVCTLTIN